MSNITTELSRSICAKGQGFDGAPLECEARLKIVITEDTAVLDADTFYDDCNGYTRAEYDNWEHTTYTVDGGHVRYNIGYIRNFLIPQINNLVKRVQAGFGGRTNSQGNWVGTLTDDATDAWNKIYNIFEELEESREHIREY